MKHYISLGAGVQSSTMALMAAHGEVEPMPDGAIFADTQAEPREVYIWLDWLEKQLPFPVYRVTRGNLAEDGLKIHMSKKGVAYYKTVIPFHTRSSSGKKGMIRHRTCTRDYKIIPIIKKTRSIIGDSVLKMWRSAHKNELAQLRDYKKQLREVRAAAKKGIIISSPSFPYVSWKSMQQDAIVCQWIGISADEPGRVKESREPWILSSHPLFERRISRNGCLDWMTQHGYPDPPRSACVFCPFRSAAEWRRLKQSPEDWQDAIEFDHEARRRRATNSENVRSQVFVHSSGVPLPVVDVRNDVDRGQLLLWDDECSGMCGV